MSKQALTNQQIAAISAGVALAADADPALIEAAAAAAAASANAATNTEQTEEETNAGGAANVTQSEKGNNEAQASVVSFLQAQVKDKDASILALNLDVSSLKSKIGSMEATYGSLLEIVRTATTNLKVSLGNSNVDLSGLSAEQLLAEHSSASAAFSKAFKAGGVAAVDAASEKSDEPQGEDPLWQARIAATRFSKTK